MDQQTIRAVATSVGYFVEFVEWIYQVAMLPEHRRAIESEVLGTWPNPDQSTRQLVIYVLDQRSRVAVRPDIERAGYRAQAQQIFRRMFSDLESNDRGRVLGLLHQLLEQLRPGCTGAAPAPPPVVTQTPYSVIDPATEPRAMQERIARDMRDHQLAREKYEWDAINRNVMKIWQ